MSRTIVCDKKLRETVGEDQMEEELEQFIVWMHRCNEQIRRLMRNENIQDLIEVQRKRKMKFIVKTIVKNDSRWSEILMRNLIEGCRLRCHPDKRCSDDLNAYLKSVGAISKSRGLHSIFSRIGPASTEYEKTFS